MDSLYPREVKCKDTSLLQVEARLLWYFQALLEHSGEIAGLQGAILQTTGMLLYD